VEAPGEVSLRVESLNTATMLWETLSLTPAMTPTGNGLVECSYRLPFVDGKRIARLVAELP
jgi:hypothetical protein